MQLRFEEWEAYRGGSASALEVRLATTPQEIEQMADRLLFEAYRIDPLSAWCRVVRHGSPRAQESLRGDALLALDLRKGAELLCLFADELGVSMAPATGRRKLYHPRNDRLGRHGESLDVALMDVGLSPHPRVLLIVEGETEEYLAKRILEHLELPLRDDELRVVVMRGVGQAGRVQRVAIEAATPVIRDRLPEYYTLRRPVCRIFVATDPEP